MAIAQIFAFLANAKVDSMGGLVDCGVDVDMKASPLHSAIENAQSELRQQYDAREERRRELEFLENGGDPLEFKIGNTKSISVQSTSLTDQLAEQYVTSKAKGSFALAASPHGDSVESSDRPGISLGRESNIADNLLLFDGENSNVDVERNTKRGCKRDNASSLEQSSQIEFFQNVKEQEDPTTFRLGFKRQAYARRNRSRPSRDIAHLGSNDLIPGHSNKPSIVTSSNPDSRDVKELLVKQPLDRIVSSILNSRPASPDGNIQVDMELDAMQTDSCSDVIKYEIPEGEKEIKASDNLPESAYNNQQLNLAAEELANGTNSCSSDFIEKNAAVSGQFVSDPLGSAVITKEITCSERVNNFNGPVKDAATLHDVDLSRKKCVTDSVTELHMKNSKAYPSLVDMSTSTTGNVEDDECSMLKRADGGSVEDSKEHSTSRGIVSMSDTTGLGEKTQSIASDMNIVANDESRSVRPSLSNSCIQIKPEMEFCNVRTDVKSEVKPLIIEGVNLNREITLKLERTHDNTFGDASNSMNKVGTVTRAVAVSSCEPANATLSKRGSTTTELQNSIVNRLKAKKAHEDAILKEARVIEATLRRAGDLSRYFVPPETHKKCHWDFVLEEMAWMANDFKQERVWKTSAAAKVCHWIASSGRLKFKQENMRRKQRSIARTLAKAMMHFWRDAEVIRTSNKASNCTINSDLLKPLKVNRADTEKDQDSDYNEVGRIVRPPVLGYAVRFLNYVSSISTEPILAEAPTTPDRIKDTGILEVSSGDQLSEESLFYIAPPGAMQVYRESVESQWVHSKKAGNSLHEEDCETSMCDSVADGTREIGYDEDEGETGTYFSSGAFEGSLPSKFTHHKRKNLEQKSYAARLYEVGGTSNVGSVPTRRIRTAARQRVGPFSAGVAMSQQVTSKTDVSSSDTNSFQDEQSSLHGGSQPRKKMEVESTADFGRQFDVCEISSKSKKKKKPKHLRYKNSFDPTTCDVLVVSGKGPIYDQRLQLDSMIQHDQRNHVKRRLESQHFDPYRNSGHFGQHPFKKLKHQKQLPETSPEVFTPTTGSMPSPVASQMSNMSSPSKLIRQITNRDRGRKNKATKVTPGKSGSGSPWSNFEDQALVVLVHDMGTNWELVSDTINSTLQFKCIFRKPSECKERHKFLMDKNTGDGADSAEDSGSSQPYPSTLPGIPKGSARQLFQRLQGPMEEDTLKTHFEKIILIGQKLHACGIQNATQEPKQITPAHNSHVVTLSHVCPNNLSGGVKTPLDLIDAITSSPDVPTVGYQGSHTNGLAIQGHPGSVTSVLPTSSANIMLQGSPGMVLGNSLPSPSTPHNGHARDAQRYSMPRPVSLPADDQQRNQPYSQMPNGRNILHPNMPVPGALPMGADTGVRMLPGSGGMGMMRGVNRCMPMPRPGFQGVSPSARHTIVSPGTMLSGSGVGMPNSVGVHSSTVSGPGNSMLRPHDAFQMPRPGQNTEEHKQMMMQDLQLHVSQGNSQSFNSMSAPFSNATIPTPVQTFPVQQHHQMHGNPHHPHSSPQQEAYAFRVAKERQIQQRIVPQSQHPFSGPTSISTIQNNYQIQSPSSGNPIPSSQARHKPHEMPQSGNVMSNQMMKQRQCPPAQPRLQQQQQPRQHPQHSKLMKGFGRGSLLSSHQNLPVDSKNQDKHLMQHGQGFFPDTLPQSSSQPKLLSRPTPQSSKQLPDNPNQVPPTRTLLSSHQHSSQRQTQQIMHRVTLHQNCQKNSDAQTNQMIPGTPTPQSSDPVVSSAIQWKPDPMATSHLATSPQEFCVGNEALMPPCSQGLTQRHFSGGLSLQKHASGGQWEKQQQPPHQAQHRPASQEGSLYVRPSSSGPG